MPSCCASAATGPASSASGGWASREPPACPTSRASTTRSASSISGTRTGSSPITSIATASAFAVDLERDYAGDVFTKEAAAFIERDDRRPFFLYLNYTVPHAELRAPEDSMALYRGKFPEKPFENPKADAVQSGSRPDSPSLGYRSQPAPHAAFAAMITRMDRDIGRLVDLLASRGLDRNTVVLFTSDNGPHMEGGADPAFFNSSGGLRGVKRDLYEGGIRVPMIVRWPGTVPAGRTSPHPWAHWDMLPTFVDLAGGKVPGGIDGMSMARALRGESQPTHPYFYWEFHERGFQQAVRMGQLEGGAIEARRAARALRSREGRTRTAGRGRGTRRYRQEDRGVPGDRADAVGTVAGESVAGGSAVGRSAAASSNW